MNHFTIHHQLRLRSTTSLWPIFLYLTHQRRLFYLSKFNLVMRPYPGGDIFRVDWLIDWLSIDYRFHQKTYRFGDVNSFEKCITLILLISSSFRNKTDFFATNFRVNGTCADHTLDFSAKSRNLGIEFQFPISDSPHTQELHGFYWSLWRIISTGMCRTRCRGKTTLIHPD